MDYIVKPNFRVVGKIFGSKIKEFQDKLADLNIHDVNQIKSGYFTLKMDDEEIKVTEDMIITTLQNKEGYCAASNGITSVILDTTLTDDLILEGLAREFVRKVQSLRKDMDLVITEHIHICYHATEKIKQMLGEYMEYVKRETLTDEMIEDESLPLDVEINDQMIGLEIKRLV